MAQRDADYDSILHRRGSMNRTRWEYCQLRSSYDTDQDPQELVGIPGVPPDAIPTSNSTRLYFFRAGPGDIGVREKTVDNGADAFAAEFALLGARGWELVSVNQYTKPVGNETLNLLRVVEVYTFKRQTEEVPDP
jgi:hypothetical protein